MKKILEFLKDNLTILYLTLIMAFIGVVVLLIYEKEFLSNLKMKEIGVVLVTIYCMYKLDELFSLFTNKDKIELKTDERKLLDKKNEFLSSILLNLQLQVDKNLKKYLEEGDIDEANSIIEEALLHGSQDIDIS